MDVAFEDSYLNRLETDRTFEGGYSQAIVKVYRKRLQAIRAALDERDFYALKSFHFEKLKGDRSHQYSMRLNDQWRLILELHGEASNKVVMIVSIEDYQ